LKQKPSKSPKREIDIFEAKPSRLRNENHFFSLQTNKTLAEVLKSSLPVVQTTRVNKRSQEPDSERKDKFIHLVQTLPLRQQTTGRMAKDLDHLTHEKLNFQMFNYQGLAESGERPRIKQMREDGTLQPFNVDSITT
jgi:hypothetical protein